MTHEYTDEAGQRLDSGPGMRQNLSESSRQRVLNLFTWDNHVGQLIEIFHSPKTRRTA
jgi:hypothetical protein